MSGEEKLAEYALEPERRKKELKKQGIPFREPEERERDEGPRTDYHRDRDRIVWSTAFRRMQNKTQVFAHDEDDHFRRRLTHSIEVAAIACAIARRLNLNEVATEAIALGHDIGHAPFGHAGEKALNEILRKYPFPPGINQVVPLKGFDHCAHAIEVVSRIETLNGTYPGLGLTLDIRDGILKHIYHQKRDPEDLAEEPFSALSEIVKCEKYKDYKCNHGSLEAQCVWFADKLTYAFDDIEDAIRAKIFNFDIIKQRKMLHEFDKMPNDLGISSDLGNNNVLNEYKKRIRDAMRILDCDIIKAVRKSKLDEVLRNLFKEHYDGKNGKADIKNLYEKSDKIQENHPDDDVRQYLFWRNKTMTIMIDDCVKATMKRIDNKFHSVADILNHNERLVDVSKDLRDAWRESEHNFYKNAMVGILFKHRLVLKHMYNAEQKIRKLFEIYKNEEGYNLVPKDYRQITENNYSSCNFGVTDSDGMKDIIKIITIRNYIAGFTDAYANRMLREYTI